MFFRVSATVLRCCRHWLQPSRLAASSSSSGVRDPELPDYNTDVNVGEHRLTRPTKAPSPRPATRPRKGRWEGLANLDATAEGSLIPETLKEMEVNEDFKISAENLKRLGQKALTREEKKKRQHALDNLQIPSFLQVLKKKRLEKGIPVTDKFVRKSTVTALALNIGIYCNQACSHCHVESSPKRKEIMSRETADRCIEIVKNSPSIDLVDITGGAPELCSEFRHLVLSCRNLGREVIDRCNLTGLLEPGQEDTAEFLAKNKVHVVASLPCYTSKNVNMQRGSGVFAKSIQALLMLNDLGYGRPDSDLELDLVYNPLGGYLPPPQKELEEKYKEELMHDFGIEFHKLYTLTNMPIKRFNDFLYRRGELEGYLDMLVRNFNVKAADKIMCVNSVNVNWDGRLSDCDFNQQLDIGLVMAKEGQKNKDISVWDITSTEELKDIVVATDNHCFGCTSGMGST